MRTVPYFLLPLVVSLFLLGAGCTGTPRENKAGIPGFPVQVTDDAGRRVTVPSPPERIVSLAPSITEILFALGLEAQVVGVTDVCDYPPAAKQKEKIGSFADPSLEKIVALKPDLVLAADINQKVVDRLERLNVPAIVLKPRDVDGVLGNITLVGRATGRERQAADLVRELRARIDAVMSKVELFAAARPKVYYEVWYEPLCTAGPGTFIDDVIRLAGGVNVAADAPQPWPQYSLEVLLRKNPDVMLHSYGHDNTGHQTAEDIARRPGWSGLNFVRHRRIYVIDADLITRPGPRLVKAVEAVAQMLHPEIFVKGKASVAPAA
ncbi:MAG: ABC transporter substrate-binding protein [Desulfotomaculales bacterium]